MREHLAIYEKQTGQVHPSLIGAPMVPEGCSHLWSDFMRLHQDRSYVMGPLPISSRDILAWQELAGVRLSGWEIDCIRRADDAFFEATAK